MDDKNSTQGIEEADDFSLDGSPGHLLHRAQQRAADMTAQALRAYGLTPRQFAVLLTLRPDEGVTQSELVRRTGIDRSTLADMLARLGKRGLIASRRTESDQRANSVTITPEGSRALEAVKPKVVEAERRMIASLPSDVRDPFVSALQHLAEQVRR
jgi:DNA-binding MarR family transcriptional regulator